MMPQIATLRLPNEGRVCFSEEKFFAALPILLWPMLTLPAENLPSQFALVLSVIEIDLETVQADLGSNSKVGVHGTPR
ncbi:MAG: hypothetical protein L6461_01875 [Anaerolineae bacterium]|nr:hypothetical protein [Anaerolineae bacterium]